MMPKIISNLGREMHIQIHEVQKAPNRLNLNRSATRHIIITFLRVKEKERIVRAAKEKKKLHTRGDYCKIILRLLVVRLL